MWLNQSPNLDQVSRWYSGWKQQMSDKLLVTPHIKGNSFFSLNRGFHYEYVQFVDNFNRALVLMHRTLGGPDGMVPPPPSAPQMVVNKPVMMDLHMVPPPPQLDFKEMVSQKCAERGIMFLPMPGRREAGKQVGLTESCLSMRLVLSILIICPVCCRFIEWAKCSVSLIVRW